ncbi:DNA-processing protein DprA [Oharaeibacter diazotrophicus]|uniref:DNA processing protein n=1 Tax=Oharaeibacter diazotrophicus TaxID=1920512 RepID=A0A4R6RJI3_9HYPH|nr:DNA-processing protein DprA [Oharaeibacter diazotrophicus]TDP86572.1 DNA processing protein [Oharaeibacter diazotrophicus]BBE71486.1 hypothetical protein OHA_1_01061 [Pleomorphomonas sp. SM30]GLS78247.1 DNA processing protein DprA [Oharaeibacter diazotrophicus]
MSGADAPGRVGLGHDQRVAWLRLIRAENVGPATFRSLVNHFGSARDAIDALPDLARRGGSRRVPSVPSVAEVEREIERTEKAGARIVTIGEPDYPAALRRLDSPPPVLTVKGGGASLAARPAVAVVGSRNASIPGIKMADRIARGLSEEGLVVVSGLARGIDAAAHRASLAGGTMAVVAGGIDHVYPEEHAPLVAEIVAAGGAIVTEMPFGWVPRAQDFPRRNRIVSGSAIAVVVVEAAARSGTLHTARFAADQGREVLAVPGSPLDPRAEGTNRLIRGGATLVTGIADIMESLASVLGRGLGGDGAAEPGAGDDTPIGVDDAARGLVLSALGPVPTAIDDLVLHTGLHPRVVSLVILELDIAGRLERHGGQLVSLVG